MSEPQNRDFGRDGVSGLVDKDRALRARLLSSPRRDDSHGAVDPPQTADTASLCGKPASARVPD